ncbi:ESAT-6 protein secretion system EspG family protein [Amycolatopsis sulphurea]|uniref:ESAT-6 protein secretion system EspG family protein n=1 Tax=Amycolatopsis sulphurea TaxID=76022 RepID=A0A2A9F8A7_9PSEU|nr:ESX secretion-associated protein EspG [Amycolatopsis sulphurea]PFG47574.1 ESAT-6 protein secretion system EspG family protein [Amycolatopsis sulphurea]
MLVLDRELVLPADCLPLAAELAGVSLPAALSPDPLWRDPDEARHYRDTAVQNLAEHGTWGRGGPREDFMQTMTVLCRGASELSATVESRPKHHYRLVVAATGTDAILACHVPASGQVLLRPARPEALAEELISELPTLPPATGPAMSVPEPDLRHAAKGTPARRDVRRVLDVTMLPRTGAGQITATVRDRLGRRRSNSDTCTYYDTQQGRYLFSISKEPGHDRHINVTPARPETMTAQLRALLDNLH